MKIEGAKFPLGFAIYMFLVVLWLAPIFLAPFLLQASNPIAAPIYAAYGSSLVCHQLNSRSLCFFPNNASISDCSSDSAHFEPIRTPSVYLEGSVGYKFPVCARDIGIYVSMLFGGIIVFILGRHTSEDWPQVWYLLLALIPMGIDGGTQMLGWRESSNLLRLLTGSIVGIALPFYFIPLLNYLVRDFNFPLKKQA